MDNETSSPSQYSERNLSASSGPSNSTINGTSEIPIASTSEEASAANRNVNNESPIRKALKKLKKDLHAIDLDLAKAIKTFVVQLPVESEEARSRDFDGDMNAMHSSFDGLLSRIHRQCDDALADIRETRRRREIRLRKGTESLEEFMQRFNVD